MTATRGWIWFGLAGGLALVTAVPASAQFAPVAAVGSSQAASATAGGISWAASLALGARMVVDPRRIVPVAAVETDPAGGQRMALALDDGVIGFWDLGRGNEIRRLPAHPDGVAALGLGKGLAVSVGRDGKALAWDAQRALAAGEIALPAAAVQVAVRRDGSGAVLALADRSLRLWRNGALDPAPLGSLDGPPAALALSDDGAWAAAADQGGQVRLWSLADRSARTVALGQPVKALFAAPDGRSVLAVTVEGEVRRIDFTQGTTSRLRSIDETVTAAALSPDGKLLAVADESGDLTLLSAADGERIKRIGQDHPLRALAFAAGGSALLAANKAGTVGVIDLAAARPVAELIAGRQGWVVINPDGSFDSARNAEGAVGWQANGKLFGAAQFTESHFEPGLLALTLERVPPAQKVKVSQSFIEPAEVTIATPAAGGTSAEAVVTVTVTARDLGDGIEAVRLYQDEREVGSESSHAGAASPVAEGKPVSASFQVTLHPGDNQLAAVAVGRSHVASKPAALHLAYAGPTAQPVLHVLAVGINGYRNPALSLNYGVPDAQGIAKFFSADAAGRAPFSKVEVTSLTNSEVRRESLLSALAGLEKTAPEDTVVVYLAGHGDTRNDQWYYLPYDVTAPEQSEQLRQRGLSNEELHAALQRIPALKVLLLIDACKSGAAVTARQQGFESRKSLVRLARVAGTHIVAAAAKEQFAVELADVGHGAFTYALLQGLAGKAAGGQDQTVTVRSLVGFVEDYLPEVSSRGGDDPQYPVADSRGVDFPLSVASARP